MRFFPTQRQLVQWSYTFGEVIPVAQKLLVITSNSQTMHCLTMHTRNTRPMLLHLLVEIIPILY